LVKKNNFIKSIAFLALVVGIGFFAFENRDALGKLTTRRATTRSELTQTTPATLTPKESLTPLPQPSEANRQAEPISFGIKTQPAIIQETPTQTVRQPSRTRSRIQTRITRAETQPLVRRPEFLKRTAILNPKAFNKRKFGIDTKLARSALKKRPSRRTRAEKLQFENLRAMKTFDSSKLTNF